MIRFQSSQKFTALLVLLLLSAAVFVAPVSADTLILKSSPKPKASTWNTVLSSGIDTYIHTYPLATADTTETVCEFNLLAGLEGRSSRSGKYRWRLRAEGSFGTQLLRERLEGDFRFLDNKKNTRLHLDGSVWLRQYRSQTDYNVSSDNSEGRLDLRGYPMAWENSILELRTWTSFLDYRTPSSLEVDYGDSGVGVFLRSRTIGESMWYVGSRATHRVYPDSTIINRKTLSLEGNYDYQDFESQQAHVYHKSQRRQINENSVRPSAWTHWTDFTGTVGAGKGRVFLDLQNEIWDYDQEVTVYFDSWRMQGVMGYSWGDLLEAVWRIGLAGERLSADDSVEGYYQFGLHAAVESFANDISGSLSLEFGRRTYNNSANTTNLSVDESSDVQDLDSYLNSLTSYSDFNYWEIWLMANWQISRHFSIDILASYQPESHTEKTDDSAIGFGSLRLVWRP